MNPQAWNPTHQEELTGTYADRFAAQTFELDIGSIAGIVGVSGQFEVSRTTVHVAVFVSAKAQLFKETNNVIIYFGAVTAGEARLGPRNRGLNDVVTHGFRSALNDFNCVLICLPGGSQLEGRGEVGTFFTIDDEGIKTCLREVGRNERNLDNLHLCAFSRGQRGLKETLNRRLIRNIPKPDLISVFDAAYPSFRRAVEESGVAGSQIRAYQVTVKERFSTKGAINIDLDPRAMRAIGYSRAINNLIFGIERGQSVPDMFRVELDRVRNQLLNLPPKGTFSTGISSPPGMVQIDTWVKLADNAKKIGNIIDTEGRETGLMRFLQKWNGIFFDTQFLPDIYSHHLFVAEFAHELGWPILGTSERFRNP